MGHWFLASVADLTSQGPHVGKVVELAFVTPP
jgi:hypothetical protein